MHLSTVRHNTAQSQNIKTWPREGSTLILSKQMPAHWTNEPEAIKRKGGGGAARSMHASLCVCAKSVWKIPGSVPVGCRSALQRHWCDWLVCGAPPPHRPRYTHKHAHNAAAAVALDQFVLTIKRWLHNFKQTYSQNVIMLFENTLQSTALSAACTNTHRHQFPPEKLKIFWFSSLIVVGKTSWLCSKFF